MPSEKVSLFKMIIRSKEKLEEIYIDASNEFRRKPAQIKESSQRIIAFAGMISYQGLINL